MQLAAAAGKKKKKKKEEKAKAGAVRFVSWHHFLSSFFPVPCNFVGLPSGSARFSFVSGPLSSHFPSLFFGFGAET